MRRVVNFLIAGMILLSMHAAVAQSPAQVTKSDQRKKPADDRMSRDIAVAENVLSTLIKQEFENRNFFFMEINGNYISGYGVTFIVPTSMLNASVWGLGNQLTVSDGYVSGYSYSSDAPAAITSERAAAEEAEAKKAMKNATKEEQKAQKDRNKAEQDRQAEKDAEYRERALHERQVYGIGASGGGVQTITTRGRSKYYNADSINAINNAKIINASKNFIADYGDMLSQLAPEERIIVTNRAGGENPYWYGEKTKRSLLSVEAKKGDLTDFRQGKLTREQLLAKIKVVNTVTSQKTEPDMELLASIFNRLYQSDLSNTYYVQNNVYYERLTDFGAILHMQVVSSITNTDVYGQYTTGKDVKLTMPTLRLNNLTQEERDKKVKELYPVFESELKENVLEYGRTLRSLNDNEQLMVDVNITKCQGCGIPTSLELAVKASVLKDFNAGKLDKNTALSKIEVKKGPAQ
jgi:hypothetical protein